MQHAHAHENKACSFPISEIDPTLDSSRDEGEARLSIFRAAVRLFAKSIDSSSFVDRASDQSIGAILAARRSADAGSLVFDSIMLSSATVKAKVRLLVPTMKMLTVLEADDLDIKDRKRCVAVSGTDRLAIKTEDAIRVPPQISATISKAATGGTKEANIYMERVSASCVKMNLYSASGTRKCMTSGEMPSLLLDRLFKIDTSLQSGRKQIVPPKPTTCPEYIREEVASFLERRVRMQCLCTAAMSAPISRPVCVDTCYLKNCSRDSRYQASIKAILHPSSSSCICAAHGLRFDCQGSIEVVLETCARPLEETHSGKFCCPCHHQAVGRDGNARFQMEGFCTECTTVSIACIHRQGKTWRKGVSVEMSDMSDEDRLEVATILISMLEFEGRTRMLYSAPRTEEKARNLSRHLLILERGFATKMQEVECEQVRTEDPCLTNSKEMLRRDAVVVDLLRGGGVFRKTVKRGERRGTPYLTKMKAGETVPLKPHESDLISTHGHLFRKG